MPILQVIGWKYAGTIEDRCFMAGNIREAVNYARTAIIQCPRVTVENYTSRKPPVEFLDEQGITEEAIQRTC